MDIEAVGAKGLSCPVGLDLKAQSLQILYQPLSLSIWTYSKNVSRSLFSFII